MTKRKIGYIRFSILSTSAIIPSIAKQKADLEKHAVLTEHIYVEESDPAESGFLTLTKLVEKELKPGDELIVPTLETLGIKSTELFKKFLPLLHQKGIKLTLLHMPEQSNILELGAWLQTNDHFLQLERRRACLTRANRARQKKRELN